MEFSGSSSDADEIDRVAENLFNSSLRSVRRNREYDVFVSFTGEDTRNTFTGHLYDALIRAGINTLIDNEGLQRGEAVTEELVRAIEGSAISVVVFSSNYADSAWCLEELCKIMECGRTIGQIFVPIFYGVDPSDVRKQWGTFGAALTRLIERLFASASDLSDLEFDQTYQQKLMRWRSALREAANLSA